MPAPKCANSAKQNKKEGADQGALNGWYAVNKEKRLWLHHLNKTEHFVGTFIGIMLIVIGHRMVGLKIFTPKLVDLKAALVYVKMDIALFKIGGTGFPYFGLGMQSLYRKPRTVADAFAMRFGQYKENIQVIVMSFVVNRKYQATNLLAVKHNAVGFAFWIVDGFFNSCA